MQTIVELPVISGTDALDATTPAAIPRIRHNEARTHLVQLEENVPSTINQSKLAILEELLAFRIMTADLLTERLFSPGMLRNTQKHLQAMERGRYVRKSLPMKQSRYGTVPYAWSLDLEGYKYLKAIGHSVPVRFRDDLHEGYPISHTLAVNQVLMKAMYLDEHDPYLTLRDFEHETTLNAKPLRVPIPSREKPISISPDLWLYFYTADRFHHCPTIEVNLSRMWQKDWREKVGAYLHCLDVYEERFGIDVLTVAVIITTGMRSSQKPRSQMSELEFRERQADARDREKRLAKFLLWTEAELTAMGATHEADLFRFTNVTLDTITPHELFYGNHWQIPFQDTRLPLIPQAKESTQ